MCEPSGFRSWRAACSIGTQFFVARTRGPAATAASALRAAVASVDKDQPVFVVTSMQELLDHSVARQRFTMATLVAFSLLVLKQGVSLTMVGLGMGLAGALLLTRFLTSLLYEVRPYDPATLAAVCLALGGSALVASYVPARRATRVDPVEALRQE
jgi:putative ABC transport system permease protein